MVKEIFKVSLLPDAPWLMAVDKGFYSIRGFRGLRMASSWSAPTFYIRNPVDCISSDFYECTSGALVYSEKVRNSPMEELFERVGEVLPAKIENGPEVYLLNITECYNCLDRQRSKYDTATDGITITKMIEYAISPDRILDNDIFKIPETVRTEIFTASGRQERGSDFYSLYHDLGLQGLSFDKIWRG